MVECPQAGAKPPDQLKSVHEKVAQPFNGWVVGEDGI